MLFNTNVFLMAFLPAVVIGFYIIGTRSRNGAVVFLVCASLFFYGWWRASYLLLILASFSVNYGLGKILDQRRSKKVLTIGIVLNLGILGYFKYANFFVDTADALFGLHSNIGVIVLPLAISFFTFQQIIYLIDTYRGNVTQSGFTRYMLFVSFFPQLIAGPIVYHKEMMPQFARETLARLDWRDIALGLTLFSIGLFKKVCLADRVAEQATPVFKLAESGEVLTFFTAWGGALSYTFQIYFDFSGYSDMALGLACLFGIRLPVNFYSPYRATNIIEFWRHWHMTLSRMLREYLYIPLGGSRRGSRRRYFNLMLTMLIGGLWHGAAWTFVVWGGLHGIYLAINHGWHAVRRRLGHDLERHTVLGRAAGTLLTFLAVVVAWVFFRAESFDGARVMLEGMAGLNGVSLPHAYRAPAVRTQKGAQTRDMEVHADMPTRWSWTPARAVLIGVAMFASVKLINAVAPSEFIYFTF